MKADNIVPCPSSPGDHDQAELQRLALTPEIKAATAILDERPADMDAVIRAVRHGDVEGARAAAHTLGQRLGARVRATLLSTGGADG